MTCRRCENRIRTGTKCFQCGFDISKGLPPVQSAAKAKSRRSPALYGVTALFMILGIIMLITNLGAVLNIPELANMTIWLTIMFRMSNAIFFINIPFLPGIVSAVIGMIVAAAQIILSIGILGRSKQAFNIYAGLLAGQGVIQIIGLFRLVLFAPPALLYIFWPYILKGVLLWIIYKTDGNHFGGGG